MDKKHKLQLSTFENADHQNPLQYVAGRNSVLRAGDPGRQQRFLKVQEMLLKHNHSLPENARIDRLPDGSFMISSDQSTPSQNITNSTETSGELSSSESEEDEPPIQPARINHSGDADEIFAVPQQNQIERDPILTPPPATASNYFSNLISCMWDSFSALLNWLRSFF
jgi:hypothetical protein